MDSVPQESNTTSQRSKIKLEINMLDSSEINKNTKPVPTDSFYSNKCSISINKQISRQINVSQNRYNKFDRSSNYSKVTGDRSQASHHLQFYNSKFKSRKSKIQISNTPKLLNSEAMAKSNGSSVRNMPNKTEEEPQIKSITTNEYIPVENFKLNVNIASRREDSSIQVVDDSPIEDYPQIQSQEIIFIDQHR